MNGWNGDERRQHSCNPNDYVRESSCKEDRERIEKDIRTIEEKYLTKELFWSHFKPIRNLLYGAIGLILVTIGKWALALMGLIK